MSKAVTSWTELLEFHLQHGTGREAHFGIRDPGEWSSEEFLIAMSGVLARNGEISRNTLESWRSGRTLPQGEHLRAMFKIFWPSRTREHKSAYDAFRGALAVAKAERKIARKPSGSTKSEIKSYDDIASLVPQPLRDFLLEIGVNASDFESLATHPPEIASCIREYLRRWTDMLPASQSRDVLVRISEYPSIFPAEFQKRHAAYYNFLHEVGDIYPEFGEVRARSLEFVGAFLEDVTLPFRKKVIVPSFFYGSSSRRDAWGVVPLAKQRAFGIVLPESIVTAIFGNMTVREIDRTFCQTPITDNLSAGLEQLAASTEQLVPEVLGAHWSPEAGRSFLRRVIRHIFKSEGRVFVRRGYVQGDILLDIFSPERLSELTSMIQDLLTVSDGADESEFPIFRAGQMPSPKSGIVLEHSCALFDLGQFDRIQEGVAASHASRMSGQPKYLAVAIRHNLEILSGIGFSLPILPFLIRRRVWPRGVSGFLYSALQAAAMEIYMGGEPSIRDEFLKIGIELN